MRLNAVRMAAHSLATAARSSAAVLHSRTRRMSSLAVHPHTPQVAALKVGLFH